MPTGRKTSTQTPFRYCRVINVLYIETLSEGIPNRLYYGYIVNQFLEDITPVSISIILLHFYILYLYTLDCVTG